MERDDEVSGNGNSYTAEYWQYDPRLGRRWNVDPVIYPWQSPYAAFNNNPIYFIDPDGRKGIGSWFSNAWKSLFGGKKEDAESGGGGDHTYQPSDNSLPDEGRLYPRNPDGNGEKGKGKDGSSGDEGRVLFGKLEMRKFGERLVNGAWKLDEKWNAYTAGIGMGIHIWGSSRTNANSYARRVGLNYHAPSVDMGGGFMVGFSVASGAISRHGPFNPNSVTEGKIRLSQQHKASRGEGKSPIGSDVPDAAEPAKPVLGVSTSTQMKNEPENLSKIAHGVFTVITVDKAGKQIEMIVPDSPYNRILSKRKLEENFEWNYLGPQ